MKINRSFVCMTFVIMVTCSLSVLALPEPPERPRIWITSDYAPSTDKDDQVVMSVLLLWADLFRIEGLVPGSHKRNLDGIKLFRDQHIAGYEKDYPNLSKAFKNFPAPAEIRSISMEASTSDGKGYRTTDNLDQFPSVKKMIEAARKGSVDDPLYVQLWGPQGEAATAIDWLLRNEPETLDKLVFIAHASLPTTKYNCEQDAKACSAIKKWASDGKIHFIECGDSGQKGIDKSRVSNKLPEQVKKSAIGQYMNKKWKDGYPDWSDGACFVILLPRFGVNYSSLKSDGSNNTNYLTDNFANNRQKMYDLIELRAKIAWQGVTGISNGQSPPHLQNLYMYNNILYAPEGIFGAATVTMSLYGTDGTRIDTRTITVTPEGPNTISFEKNSKLSSGVYFVKFDSNGIKSCIYRLFSMN